MLLDEIMARLDALPAKARAALVAQAVAATQHIAWVPNPGPQTEAFHSAADEVCSMAAWPAAAKATC